MEIKSFSKAVHTLLQPTDHFNRSLRCWQTSKMAGAPARCSFAGRANITCGNFTQVEESRVTQYLPQNYYSKGFKAIYLTFLKCYFYTSKKKRKETCTEQKIGRFLEHTIIA